MKAALYHRYGPPEVLTIGEAPPPRLRRGWVRVRNRASGVNPVDWKVRMGRLWFLSGPRFPKIPGGDFSGEILEVGAGVQDLRPGDRVFGLTVAYAGGACAQELVVRAPWVGRVPDGISHVQAASLPIAGLTAFQCLRDLGRVGPGSKVLINGGSGGVGTFAIQLGRILGAEVTAVCSGRNADLVRSLGAHHVIDYTAEDPFTTGPWDLFFDAVAVASYPQARASLAPRGVYVHTDPRGKDFFWAMLTALTPGRRARGFLVRPRRRDLEELVGMVADGRVRPVIDRELPLDEIVAAHSYLETGRARGKVVLRIP